MLFQWMLTVKTSKFYSKCGASYDIAPITPALILAS